MPKQKRSIAAALEGLGDQAAACKLWFLRGDAAKAYRQQRRRQAFDRIMHEGRWGDVHLSGGGSTEDVTVQTRLIILKFIGDLGLQSMLDVPCGDLVWMSQLFPSFPPRFAYTGGDIVPALVERNSAAYPHYTFRLMDMVSDPLPAVDLIFCRDGLQHLPVADIQDALDNFSASGSRFLLTTTHLRRWGLKNHQPCRVGSCRDRNLMLPPFNLANPLAIFSEQNADKFLGLWRLPLTRV